MHLSLKALSLAIGAEFRGQDGSFQGVCTDSRLVQPGNLFIALTGKHFDGHHFLKKDAMKNVAGACVQRPMDCKKPLLIHEQPKIAYGQIARLHHQYFKTPLWAITGSCGKTTVKEMLKHICQVLSIQCCATQSNENNEIGVPLTLLKLNKLHEIALIEMGARHPGDIKKLCEIAKPDIALVTNIRAAHLETFLDLDHIVSTKGAIYQALDSDGTACINWDEPNAAKLQSMVNSAKILTFGLAIGADLQAKNLKLGTDHTYFEVHLGQESSPLRLPIPGLHNISNALGALAVANAYGLPLKDSVQALTSFVPITGRLSFSSGLHDSLIIDDTYNSNPASLRAALRVLASQTKKFKILVMGDMGELGIYQEEIHSQFSQEISEYSLDFFCSLGELTQHTFLAYSGAGQHFIDIFKLIKVLKTMLNPNTCVLIKGSRFMQMEKIVQAVQD